MKVKVLDGATAPAYMTVGSAGFDISSYQDTTVIRPGERALIKTGLFFELPEGYELQIRPRSGLALKHGITVLNSPGTIDSDYRGEVGIILFNSGRDEYIVNRGDRVAQGVIAKYEQLEIEVAVELSETERGTGGFGSTGVK